MKSKTKIVISVFSITIIIACVIQAFPKYSQMQKEKGQTTVSEESEIVVETNRSEIDLQSEEEGNTTDEDIESKEEYISTQEYKDTQNRIQAVRERIRLLNNNITADLTDLTKMVFNQITSISLKPDDKELLRECQQYMTDDCFKRFAKTEFERDSYMVYDIKFSDLDKDDISAYVLTRSSEQYSFFVTYSFDKDKNYVISNILQITNGE